MKIYAELAMSPAERCLLNELAAGQELWVSLPGAAAAEDERAFSEAEVAFGAVSKSLLRKARRLRWIQFPSVGVDAYRDVDWSASGETVICTNLRGVFDEPVAQSVLAGILEQYRGIGQLVRLQMKHDWRKMELRPQLKVLRGAHVLMLGNGALATRVRELLSAFGCTFTVFARTSGDLHTLAELDAALPQADIVFAALPETPSTSGMLDAQRIGRMKEGALFVNVGRGSLVDEAALVRALQSGRLCGAVLDVTRAEPLSSEDTLWDAPRLFLTQHTSAGSDQETVDVIRFFGQNLARYQARMPLLNVVDWGRGY
jgi:phosphoglycerate dehydrogenase-like enzyme